MSAKAVTITTSVSTDTRVAGRYFVDVRDVTGGRNRQMTTKVTDDPAAFIADVIEAADQHGVAVTVTDESGELARFHDSSCVSGDRCPACAAAVLRSAPAARPAAPVADDLDALTFPELMAIAKLHNVPGRGTARKGQLIAGIRAARGDADAAFRRAMSDPGHVNTPQPVTAPALLPGKAAPALVWSGRRELSGRYAIEGVKRGGSTRYRGVSVNGSVIRTALYPRLRDAQAAVQMHHETLHQAHNTAAAMERARVAGDARWASLDEQMINAINEDGRRSRAARPAGPRPLSGLGALRAAYAETHPVIR